VTTDGGSSWTDLSAGLPERWTGNEMMSILAGYGGWSLFIGFLEEIVFRGMVVRELALRWGWGRGIVYGGLFFGVSHLLNLGPDLTVTNAVWIVGGGLIYGACLAALYLRSGSLWLPIGFHAGWNFCLSAIVGAVMSGNDSSFGLWQLQLTGPALLTGGDFGIETSVVSLAIMAALTLVVLQWRRKPIPTSGV